MLGNRHRRALLACATAAAVAGATMAAPAHAQSAVGCQVDYAVTAQWGGGFTADLTVRNLGAALSGWQLVWSFPAGQQVTQGWNADYSQNGSQVTAANAGWNRDLGSGASVSIGFNGSWQASNPAPTGFALNGVTCTGAVTPTSSPPPTATTAPPSAPPPPSSPPPSPPTTSPPPPTAPPAPSNTPTVPPAAYPQPGLVTGNIGAHDPTMVRRPDGTYLLAVTAPGIGLKTSTDRIDFRDAGVVWPNGASWTTPYTGGDRNLWAPDLSYHNGRYYLYYSASTFGSRRSAIFLATSTTGAAGSWTHEGLVIETDNNSNFNAIDPNLIIDEQGRWWLTLGSFWTGIKLIRLDNATGLRSTSDTAVRSLAQRPSAGGAVEAPFIIRHGDYYYLFVAFDSCCQGANSTYRVMVGRSTSITGPYVDRNGTAMTAGGGTQVLAGHGSIHGPGHPAVMSDADGMLLLYHYYTPSNAARLGINMLGFDSAGWPFVY